MSNEMIERVKMAIKNNYLEWWKPELHHALLPDHIVDQLARAAMEAMREPTAEMRRAAVRDQAGGDVDPSCWKWGDDGERVDGLIAPYEPMINAALGEDQ